MNDSALSKVDVSTMRLEHLNPERIACGPVPMDDLLKDSLYYPACRTDGRPIKLCNTLWRRLGVNSFVYCDFDVSEEVFLHDTRTLLGYHVLGHRRLRAEEYIPEGWQLEMVPSDAVPDPCARPHYWDSFLGHPGPEHFAHWVVFERNADRPVSHGPERISLLYVCGEGLATFQQLYCSRRLAPKMLCFIQCWGFAGNWTNFTGVGAPFHRTLLKYRECIPEWICLGDAWHIDGAQRFRNLEYARARCLGYYSLPSLARRLGAPVRVSARMDKTVLSFSGGSRQYVSVSVCHQLSPVLYDVTDCRFDIETFVDYITLRDSDSRPDQEMVLNAWTGLRGMKRSGKMRIPVLDEKLAWRPKGGGTYRDMAAAIIRSIGEMVEEDALVPFSPMMLDALYWSCSILRDSWQKGPETEKLMEYGEALLCCPARAGSGGRRETDSRR